jgi:arginyl-tRNA synthetase
VFFSNRIFFCFRVVIGLTQPKLVADRIIAAMPAHNPVTTAVSAAPNGFINITLSPNLLVNVITKIVSHGCVPPPVEKKKVLVDFSSPNIAKEMHVGHLRSTIIGDSICRMLEFVGHEVLRVNHVGDWGTQFGMLITYLLAEYPDFLTNPPDISNLTKIYKESKKRFDEDPQFKETSRLNVVRLQSGDPTCRTIWLALCDISRKEFQKVYDMLGVTLEEVGESFYNPIIPGVIEELRSLNLVEQDAGMEIIKLPHFTIPLILRKSDGGFGYDSTDMAALKHRLFTLQRDWIIIITDAGQANHFHMCFDAARTANWLTKNQRLDHIGFGVVCGEDGKRFKTRSSETVRLIDLLHAAKERMHESLVQRQQQHSELASTAATATAESSEALANLVAKKARNIVPPEEIEAAAEKIGYGAVKYFDLKQHPETNYIFSYENMLNTKGDTAVYLLFAYARVASILRKAEEEKNIQLAGFLPNAEVLLQTHLTIPEERALAFELLQFGDCIVTVLNELLPNRLCDYIKELSVKFTEFVTKCQVLNNENVEVTQARLLLCEATRRTMKQCFALLGIEPCERI